MAEPDAELGDAEPGEAELPNAARQITLDDVAQLQADSDYSPFLSKSVSAAVRNAAMNKLFHADPHFQQRDRLDVHADDCSSLPVMRRAQRREMMLARDLGLLDDELVEQDLPEPDGGAQAAAAGTRPGSTPAGAGSDPADGPLVDA